MIRAASRASIVIHRRRTVLRMPSSRAMTLLMQ
jgi:hypothetical protein